MEENKAKCIPFGVKLRCGNFYVEKVSRALSKRDAMLLRKEFLSKMPKGYKGAQRASMPVIRVGDIAGVWRIEYGVSSAMYHIFDAFDYDDNGFVTDEACSRLLTMLFCDTTVLGDSQYFADRVKALNEFSMRVKAVEVSDEEEEKTFELLKALDTVEHGEE